VGAIGHCMDELIRLELDDMLRSLLGTKPLMGICLGIQALMTHSEESEGVSCLGAFPGDAIKFAELGEMPDGTRHKVPHMGWNRVKQARSHPIWKDIAPDAWFYFVHSYYVVPTDARHVI